jgi:KDO2-lipid IV(A) lauroyltransferase
VIVFLVKTLLWLLSLLPAGAPYWLATRGAGLWMRLSPTKRHTTERNLERCYPLMSPPERARLARESFVHYLCSILETGHNWYWPLERLQARCIGVVGEDLIARSRASKRGVVVLAPHFGAWEYLGMYLQSLPDQIAILYKPPSNPQLERALLEKRRRGGANLIAANARGLRELYAHLRDGKGAGILPDQQPSRGKGRFAPFFGIPALTAVLVPRLVQRTDCNVLLTACERLPGGRYRVHFMEADPDIRSGDMDTALAAVNRGVERCIAIDPPQYLWSYKRFKTRPEGEKPFYPGRRPD